MTAEWTAQQWAKRVAKSGAVRDAGERFALAYCDPPFATGREHLTTSGELAFDDRWPTLGEYLKDVGARIVAARDLLIPEGCLVLHVDPKTSHYLKVLCDHIFGEECFASEIVWRYRRRPSKTQNFQRVHDVLLRYVRDAKADPRFNQLFEPLSASTVKTWGNSKQRAVTDETGRRKRSSATTERSPGTPLGDVWEISIIAPIANERTGYPTQKPEALLERLILSLTHEGDSVLDPYCGSATTLAVCKRLGRNAVGIDASETAIRYANRRLSA